MRRIEVEAFCDHAREAATVLVLMGAADEVYPSFLVPGRAVWSLNGEPQLPDWLPPMVFIDDRNRKPPEDIDGRAES